MTSWSGSTAGTCKLESEADLLQRLKENPTRIEYQNWYKEIYNFGWGPDAKKFKTYKPSRQCLEELANVDKKISRLEGQQSQQGQYGPYGPIGQMTYQKKLNPKTRQELVKLMRDRLVSVAKMYVGLNYQHHHVPTWNPQLLNPQQVQAFIQRVENDQIRYIDDTGDQVYKRQLTSPGIDCSNFTSWIYNIALGIQFTSGIEEQAGAITDLKSSPFLTGGQYGQFSPMGQYGQQLGQAMPMPLMPATSYDDLMRSWLTTTSASPAAIMENENHKMDAPGRILSDKEKREPGDLVFFWPKSSLKDPSKRTRIEHVGMYIGNGNIINSSTNKPEGVKIEPLSNFNGRIAMTRRIIE